MSNDVVAIDTSVAVPLLVRFHPDHQLLRRWALPKTLALCGHAYAETYSVLTRLPVGRLEAVDAASAIEGRFVSPLTLPPRQFRELTSILARAGVKGGATYDGLVALTARAHATTLATRDARARSTYEALGVRVELVG